MFDIAFSEVVVIAVVALIVIGPERLPKVARTLGHMFGRLQRYVAEVKADINREMELDELRKLQNQVQSAAHDFERSVSEAARDVETGVRSVESELNAAGAAATTDASVASARPTETTTTPASAAAPAASADEAPRQASLPGIERI
ncbi:MAG TPA: Sec-independent protein translocase protein TatB [Casimicrobiaceae bacterium]|nr:Sec-independent protein translocase protein TatB [Casimicrobiaceae bacterium]